MKVAVFVDGDGFAGAGADDGFRGVFEVHSDAAPYGFDVDKGDVVLFGHRVGCAADIDFDGAGVQLGNDRDVFFGACIHGVGDEFFHRFSAAYDGYIAVNDFFDHVAAVAAFIKFCSHIIIKFGN